MAEASPQLVLRHGAEMTGDHVSDWHIFFAPQALVRRRAFRTQLLDSGSTSLQG
jgi:hypothetical protein